jgi:hypothetical protein
LFAFTINPVSALEEESQCSNMSLNGTYLYNYYCYPAYSASTKPEAYSGIEVYNGDGTGYGYYSGFAEDGGLIQEEFYTFTY